MASVTGEWISDAVVTGRSAEHVIPLTAKVSLHPEVAAQMANLQKLAAKEGIDLQVASGYRSFSRQLDIWNAKAEGRRPVLDDSGNPVDISQLSPRQLLFTLLRWSALPGASRHHWGTDMDLWDRAAVAADYQLQLTPQEYAADGPFAALAAWLGSPQVAALGFERPYLGRDSGVAPEPWHLSFQPLAQDFERRLTVDLLVGVIGDSEILLKSTILEHFEEIFGCFVCRHGA